MRPCLRQMHSFSLCFNRPQNLSPTRNEWGVITERLEDLKKAGNWITLKNQLMESYDEENSILIASREWVGEPRDCSVKCYLFRKIAVTLNKIYTQPFQIPNSTNMWTAWQEKVTLWIRSTATSPKPSKPVLCHIWDSQIICLCLWSQHMKLSAVDKDQLWRQSKYGLRKPPQHCFQDTDWDVFAEGTDLEGHTSAVLSCIYFCAEFVSETKTVQKVLPN